MNINSFIKKNCFVITLFILTLFSFNLGAADLYFTSGAEQLKKAEKAQKLQVDPAEIKTLLSGAWEKFLLSQDPLAVFFLFHTGLKLGDKEKELLLRAVPLIKQARASYIETIATLPILTLDDKIAVKNYLTGIEENIPFISDIHPGKETVYPLKGEKPDLLFHLNQQSQFSWAVNGAQESISELNGGNNFIELEPGNLSDYPRTLNLTLEAKNEYATERAKCTLSLNLMLPDPLQLINGEYSLANEPFRSETKIQKKVNLTMATGGLILSTLLGLVMSKIEADPETGQMYTPDEKKMNGWLGFSAGALLTMLLVLSVRKESRVPDTDNIEFNKKLRERIEELKKEMIIQVEMNEETTKSNENIK